MPRLAIQDQNASLSFDGVNSYVNTASNSTLSLANGFTVGGWIYIGKFITASTRQKMIATTNWGFGTNSTTKKLSFTSIGVQDYDSTGTILTPGRWVLACAVFDSSNDITFYLNGELDSVVTGTNPATTTASITSLGQRPTPTDKHIGYLSRVRVWNNELTAAQIRALYTAGIVPSGVIAEYLLNEGAGTIAYDSSGNGNNGTITAGTWVRDTPTKKRKTVNDNLVYNGDFELPNQHSFDDSARTTDDNIGSIHTATAPFPYVFGSGGTWSAELDTAEKYSGSRSLKLSTTSVGAICTGLWGDTVYTVMPILPNTTYTLTAKVKTNNVAANGAYLTIGQFTMAKVYAGAGASTNKLSGTNDWTTVTASITTSATAGRFYIYCYNGVAGNISDAWFDDVELRPTTPETRIAISGPYRQPVDNMVRNGDFEYTPAFTAATNTVAKWVDGTAAGSAATKSPYVWSFYSGTGTIQFDSAEKYTGTNSLKVSNVSAGAVISAGTMKADGVTFTKASGIPVLPSTSYTVSYWMKTTAVSGSANAGASVRVAEYGGDGNRTVINTLTVATISTTTGWTYYTNSFTTLSTGRFVNIRPAVVGNDGAGTLIMDAWFDDIKLDLTSNTTRTIA